MEIATSSKKRTKAIGYSSPAPYYDYGCYQYIVNSDKVRHEILAQKYLQALKETSVSS